MASEGYSHAMLLLPKETLAKRLHFMEIKYKNSQNKLHNAESKIRSLKIRINHIIKQLEFMLQHDYTNSTTNLGSYNKKKVPQNDR